MEKKNKIFFIFSVVCMVFIACNSNHSKGATLFERNCANCHGKSGEGFKNLYPALTAQSRISGNLDLLPCIIKYGIHEGHLLDSKEYSLPMLSQEHLSDIDITNIRNFVVNKMLDKKDYKSLEEVKNTLKRCQTN